MTDRELLEKAAKAAGYEIEWVRNSGCYYRCEEDVGREEFNPLDDDGDAFRLMVKLKLLVDACDDGSADAVADGLYLVEKASKDAEANARRAIVRAAAAIGEQL